MNLALSTELCTHRFGQFSENVWARIVSNGMTRVQPQSVKVILPQPVQRVVNEKTAYGPAARAVKIDRLSPRGAMTIGEELRRVNSQIIALRPKVVVNHVQKHHQIFGMRRINQTLQVFRSSITSRRSIWQNAVVSPVSLPRKTRQWHQFDRDHAEVRQVIQLGFDARKCSFGRKRPYMQFVNYGFIPAPAFPVGILPVVGQWIDYFTWAMHS